MIRATSVLMFGACMAAFASPLLAQSPRADAPTISTTGHASIQVAPDVAWLTVTAETRASSTPDAQSRNAAAIAATKTNLAKAGVKDDAVHTRGYSVEPQMQFTDGTSKVVGFIARQQLEVRVDDLTALGTVIDAAGAQGATFVSNVRYDVKNRAGLESEALGMAVKDGLRRAEVIARAAGRTVSGLKQIDDQRIINGPQPIMYRMAAGAGRGGGTPTDITPNEIEITAQVTVTVWGGGVAGAWVQRVSG